MFNVEYLHGFVFQESSGSDDESGVEQQTGRISANKNLDNKGFHYDGEDMNENTEQ